MERKHSGIGVLLVNLGTPDAADYRSIRRYLREFLSDRRVIETNPFVWWFVLNLVILPVRPARKVAAYRKIWNRARNESPLKTITRAQAEKLAAAFTGEGRIKVDWAMRYGNPSIPSRLAALRESGCDRILIVPLYPQYAAATTASVTDKALAALQGMRWQPTLRFAPPYFDDPAYIEAVAAATEEELAKIPWKPEVVLASFHGIPKECVEAGDPYEAQCRETVRLLRARLKLDESAFRLTFQSRFGRAEWLGPATDATVRALAQAGVKNLAVVTPGFAADCLETLEEIAGENAEIFRHAGGERFAAIPCLNDSVAGMGVIRGLVARELAGWI
jgi:protoporphyrin/coproporphyrin ferrochelatase